MGIRKTEVAVTLSGPLYERLRAEAEILGVSLEWVVAAMVADTIDPTAKAEPVAA
ncbi:MAG: hypothetical protein U0800_20410 [Isosphaeraceae bacterium]